MAQDWTELARLSDASRVAVAAAAAEARLLRDPYLGTEHLLLGLLAAGGSAGAALAATGVVLDAARDAVTFIVGYGDQTASGPLSPTPRLRGVVVWAAGNAGDEVVGTGSLLLGILADEDCTATGVLGFLGIQLDQLRGAVQ